MVGAVLKKLRKERGYSLRQLAAATGLSHSFLCDVERGRCKPSLDTLQVLAGALQVAPEIFLSRVVVDTDRPAACQ
jgi:transcriptional regulator with XRE-family HTH domain